LPRTSLFLFKWFSCKRSYAVDQILINILGLLPSLSRLFLPAAHLLLVLQVVHDLEHLSVFVGFLMLFNENNLVLIANVLLPPGFKAIMLLEPIIIALAEAFRIVLKIGNALVPVERLLSLLKSLLFLLIDHLKLLVLSNHEGLGKLGNLIYRFKLIHIVHLGSSLHLLHNLVEFIDLG
jgi:hypothetical protein